MSCRRISLLKLIDLAVGFPVSGSVNFNLLHKILYILAIRGQPHSSECDEIELSTSTDVIAVTLNGSNDQDQEFSRTRLMVQRVLNGTGDEHWLKITGSRIVIPWEDRQPAAADSERIETRISAMSSVVSELEERVQEITQKPAENCNEILKELQKRMETLEGMVEHQTAKVSIEDFQQTEPYAEVAVFNTQGVHELDRVTQEIWDAIRSLQSTVGQLFSNDTDSTANGDIQSHINRVEDGSQNQTSKGLMERSNDLKQSQKDSESKSEEVEATVPSVEKQSYVTKLLRILQLKQTKHEESLKTITEELGRMRQNYQRLLAKQKDLQNQFSKGIQQMPTSQKSHETRKPQDTETSKRAPIELENTTAQDNELFEDNKTDQQEPMKAIVQGSRTEATLSHTQSMECDFERLQEVQSCTSRIDRLENLVSRLFQEKTDDVNIDARVRQSVQLASKHYRPSIPSVPAVGPEALAQTRQLLEDRISSLWDQLQLNTAEISTLREILETKTNEELLLSFTADINEQLRQLKLDVLAFGKSAEMRDDRAAGTKMKPLLNVQCISCDREVPMKACEDVIPVPPTVRSSRVVKPSLRYRLQEIRRSFRQRQGSATCDLEKFETLYRELAVSKSKRKK
ncbi:golgin subfamily A member 2-like [Malaya genurostris]|uniref:golgin subfamily A member 2-like n=1 Tax=Malaya genurostris TaxID=325434 RepID=UPI0026F3B4BA|nr:golgin subfamily A member 2-like [Malaya genurostris]